MPDPRATMKRKKQQIAQNLDTAQTYVFDIIVILEYSADNAQTYIATVIELRKLQEQSPDLSLVQLWEMIKHNPELPDLGSRYRELILMIDLFLDLADLQNKTINTLI